MPVGPTPEKGEPPKKTALQVINEMVNARLKQSEVDYLDDHGFRGEGKIPSREHQLLQDRGLKVLSVSIGGLTLNPEIEQTIIKRWSTSWLKNAKIEGEQIERRKNIIEAAAREQAIRQYAHSLSREIIQKKPVGVKETLRTLLMRTRTIIFTNDQLRRRMTDEEQQLEEIIKWIEVND
jgi:regulator of protease activity HflC (stomatin/prohibitin superfamily)